VPPVGQDRLPRSVAPVSALHAQITRSVQRLPVQWLSAQWLSAQWLRRHPMPGDASAFWLASPGTGEIRPERVPAPARDEVSGPHPAHRGVAGAPRRWSSPDGCRPASGTPCGRRTRRATSRPRSSTATSTSAWSRRACGADRPDRVLPLPAPDPLRGARLGGRSGTARGAGPPGGAGRDRGDRGQRAVGRRPADRRPDRGGRRGHGGRVGRGRRGRPSGRTRPASRPGPVPRPDRGRPRRVPTPPRRTRTATATWSSTPAPPRPG